MKKLLATLLAVVMMLGCVSVFASCGDDEELNFGKELLAVASQLDALNGLTKGDADIAIIDSVMAGYYMNTGDTYKDYQILEGVILAEEQYGIGAKKGNDALIGKINEAMIALAANGGLKAVSDTYGLTSEVLVKADTTNPQATAVDGSWNAIVTDGTLVIGYTLFAPIAYNDGDGDDAKLVGFDIDLAKAVVAYLNTTYGTNVAVEFQVIEWNQKEALLENGSIDLVWNGMTITDERVANMAMSVPYLANKQVAVVKKADAANYGANKEEFVEKVSDCVIIVEKGSAGEELVLPVE
ncbi:MAG: transporter substrate-binding domain-containing protein [Clostridia bacterium]|nr:transporter substrate-binding domain-containing protein [Clostridia bacterium]